MNQPTYEIFVDVIEAPTGGNSQLHIRQPRTLLNSHKIVRLLMF